MEKVSTNRDMLFLSRAWEDNDVTEWFALQLAKEGYGVWCDLTKLLGGENWPAEINQALKTRTQKFLFVLSRSSIKKDNTLGELELARAIMKEHGIDNFVTPLRVDGIQKSELDFRLQNVEWVDFTDGWHSGFLRLLKLLNRDGVNGNATFGPQAVNSWWSQTGSYSIPLIASEETLSSNRFEILSCPQTFFVHVCNEKPDLQGHVHKPIIPYKNYLISFGTKDELKGEKAIRSDIIESHAFPISSLMDGSCPLLANPSDARNQFVKLLNQSFEKFMSTAGLYRFKLSNGSCYFFHNKVLENGRIIYTNNGELNKLLRLWGKHLNQGWLFALQVRASCEPNLHYSIIPHLLVSGTGGIHGASPGVTSSWTNDNWRDKLRAAMLHLSTDRDTITLLNSGDTPLAIQTASARFISPVTYEEPPVKERTGE